MKIKNITKNLKNELATVSLIILALIPTIGSLVYFLYQFNALGMILSLVITLVIGLFIYRHIGQEPDIAQDDEVIKDERSKYWQKILSPINILLIFLFIFLAFFELIKASTTAAIISPWQIVSPIFFLYFSFSVILTLLYYRFNYIQNNLNNLFLSFVFVLSFSVALIVYAIGYGFDPFIHQASMEYIAEKGLIEPKTPYYIGYYSLVIFFSKISATSIELINKIIVPILAAISIPFLLSSFFDSLKNKYSNSVKFFSVVSLLAIGFSPFIISTPQNLSYLFLLIAILLLFQKNIMLSLLFSVATICIHPLSGIPLACFWLFVIYTKNKERMNRYTAKAFLLFSLIISSIALPFSLFLAGGKSISIDNFNYFWQTIIPQLFSFNASGSQNIFLNFSYFIYHNYPLLIDIVILISVIYFFVNKSKLIKDHNYYKYKALILSAVAIFFSFILSSLISFKDVIDYEQLEYTKRIFTILIIFFLPFILIVVIRFAQKIFDKPKITSVIWIIFITLLISSSLYLSYPRQDNYYNSRGYSTGLNDIKAVLEIENISDEKYIVLANQQLSVAALSQFGFNRYLEINGDQIYFYPIPTGGKLYDFYLNAVYNGPSRENIFMAMDFASVDKAYLVINNYWHNSAQIINDAKASSDNYFDIDKEVYIFQYNR